MDRKPEWCLLPMVTGSLGRLLVLGQFSTVMPPSSDAHLPRHLCPRLSSPTKNRWSKSGGRRLGCQTRSRPGLSGSARYNSVKVMNDEGILESCPWRNLRSAHFSNSDRGEDESRRLGVLLLITWRGRGCYWRRDVVVISYSHSLLPGVSGSVASLADGPAPPGTSKYRQARALDL